MASAAGSIPGFGALGRVIGRGNHGIVFEVLREDGVAFATKQVDLFDFHDEDLDSTQHEVSILKRLHHPGVVRFYGLHRDEAANKLYITTELCRGGRLDKYVSARLPDGRIPPGAAIRLARLLLEALRYLHLEGVMHRDIKVSDLRFRAVMRDVRTRIRLIPLQPENILLGFEDLSAPKLADLGESKASLLGSLAFTVAGSYIFMAPEVIILEDKTEATAAGYSVKADVWSLGVTLYVLLAGGGFPQAYPLKSKVAIKALAGGGTAAAAWRMPPLPRDVPTVLSDLIQVRVSRSISFRRCRQHACHAGHADSRPTCSPRHRGTPRVSPPTACRCAP